jgi:cyclopropane-fatty-acyl-phospholipid synthase
MSFAQTAGYYGERLPLPDLVSKAAISLLVGRTQRKLAGGGDMDLSFARDMSAYPIATHTSDANAQHYEIPAEFFALCLGPQRKYSCCLYDNGIDSLAAAEERALAATAEHAGLADGQRILELGCGWGSLSLWMARHYPNARITSVSNSHSQRAYILGRAQVEGLSNLDVVTTDMNDFLPEGPFDRVVSVEMFEHMSNWTPLLQRVRRCLADEGRLFIHIFTHKTTPYRFHVDDKDDWIAQHFFTGGIMPSHGLIHRFPTLFTVENEWRWSGTHYRKTAAHWLENYDRNSEAALDILRGVYGDYAALWQRRWRLFFLATMGLFGHNGGTEWGVSHYRLKPS